MNIGGGGEADTVQREREEVMAQAEQFMLRVNTYGPDLLEGEEMPVYREQVSEVITPSFDTEFLQSVPANEQVVSQAGLSRTCQVFSTGGSVIDEDSATALVAGAFVNSYPETPGSPTLVEADPACFRVEVRLVKTRGTWLVDDFDPVTGVNAPGADEAPGELPAPDDIPSLVLPEEPPSAELSADPSTGGAP
ncbi:MAG: hypothetical protein LH477_11780 [Nocardioides sp.]|nr:hypothetical protein [Nocardioides sp.]